MRLSVDCPLVLGSASPRRREILTCLRVPFEVVAADADESVRPGEAVTDYLPRIAAAKLAAVRAKLPAALANRAPAVLVADTSVVADAMILGKPEGDAEGRAMIERLAGRVHEVHTRFVLGGVAPGEPPVHEETVVTRVTFRALGPGEVEAYVASGEGRDKAGGYAIQGLAASFACRIDGSYSAVVGLPACEVAVALSRLGLR
jgi:septum formation protein